ncbi:MAG: peptidoglycan DD-metalloendopeptidase family protein [Cyanobacteria bacterium J06634_6]
MTAPQHDAETSMQQANAEQANAEQTNTEPEVDQFTTRQKVQRCWFVTLGLLGGFSFVTSQMGLAMAETDFTIPDYSSGSSAFAAGVADDNAPIIDYSGVNYIEAASSENYSVSASDLSLEPVAASVAAPDQLAPVPEAFIEVPVAPAEVARTLAPTLSFSTGHEQATAAEGLVQSPAFTTQASATEAEATTEAEAAAVDADTTDSESGFIAFEVSPAAVPSAVIPTVTPVAPPAFTAEQKPAAHKIATNRGPAPSMSGFMETSTIAAPRSAYGHAQASSLSQATLVANVTNVINTRSLRSAAPTAAEPIILAMAGAPTPDSLQTSDVAPTTPSVVAEVVPDIAPGPSPEPEFIPAPAAPPVVDVAPAAEAPVVQPTEIVPAALPEDINLPEEYNSVFVDPTDYSVGATETPSAEAPAVIISEQSTGCEFTVSEQGSVPNGACGTAPGSANSPIAEGTAGGGYNAPAAQNLPEWQVPAPVNAPVANATANAPVSYNPSGIQLSTSAAGRAYLNRSVRPLVNLQAAEQFIFPLAVPSPITSLFGFRIHPIFGDQRFHAGTDIGAEQGTPVLAAQDGIVTGAAYSGGYGLMVVLQHEAEEVQLESRYAHLAEIFVESGKEVKKGDIIGLVGSTGNSTGPHLHFEMRQMTADGWVLVNADGLIQASLANLVKTLNNPMQTLSFNFSDFNLSNLRAGGSIQAPNASSGIPTFPGNNGIPFRPAQPNAS